MWYFYVLQSQKDLEWFYKGSTNDLIRRLQQHNSGEVESSRPYRIFKLVYYEAYLSEKAARKREMAVKKSGSIWVPLRRRIKESLNN
jgi:putative endonuclease